ncbi:MAG: hypothetical protein VKQ33_08325 [Candidatus Sericytochromatia bacterium]|nr:hypothetical protein [Candidatus Sericytochromatia bacterium]
MKRLLGTLCLALACTACGTTPAGLVPAGGAARAGQALEVAGAGFGLSGQLRLTRRPWSVFRPTYDLLAGARRVGVVQRKFFAATSTWRLMDPDERDIGQLEQAAVSFGFRALVRSASGALVGEVRQDVLRSLVRPGVVLRLLDGSQRLVLRSSPAWFTLNARVDLLDGQAQRIGTMTPVWFATSEARLLDLQQPIDRRLLLAFLAAQVDLSQRRHRQDEPSSPAPAPSGAPVPPPATPVPPAPPVPSPPPPLP